MSILNEIAESRYQDFPKMQKILGDPVFIQTHLKPPKRIPLSKSLQNRDTIGIISELKPASPSMGKIIELGVISENDISSLMDTTLDNISKKIGPMIRADIAGISVLTEPRKFRGSFGNLLEVSRLTPPHIPILLKDFISSKHQLELGKKCGASNALLIPKICDPEEMFDMMIEVGLEPLIELHDTKDLEKIAVLAKREEDFVIGINNRNLKTMQISFEPTITLLPLIKEIFGEERKVITESGIFTRNEILKMEILGIQGALIGTSVMQAPDIYHKIRALQGRSQPFVKICGITDTSLLNTLDSQNMNAYGLVIDVPSSKRNLSIKEGKKIMAHAPNALLSVVVTKDKTLAQLRRIFQALKPDLLQPHGLNLQDLEILVSEFANRIIMPLDIAQLSLEDEKFIIKKYTAGVFAFILDSSEGKGKKISPKLVEGIFQRNFTTNFILAGGIGPENISSVLKSFHPFGIDASTGLELKGIKDRNLIHRFFEQIQSFDSYNQSRTLGSNE